MVDANGGFGFTYQYSEQWSTSLSFVGGESYNDYSTCILFCGIPDDQRSTLRIKSRIYLTQNFIVPMSEDWSFSIKAGINRTSIKLEQETRNSLTDLYEISYQSGDSEWGTSFGAELNYRLGDSWSVSYGVDRFSYLSEVFSYIKTSYDF